MGDAFHRTGNGSPGRADAVEGLHHPGVDLPVRVILNHPDLLADDALLLGHALLGKIRNGDEGEQDLQILGKVRRGIEVVARHGVGGKGIGLRAVFSQFLQGVAFLGIEHLVFEIVGDAGRCIQPAAIQTKTGIHTAVACGKKGVLLGIAGLGDHAHLQPVGQHLPMDGFPDTLIKRRLHCAASFPRRKYTVSKDTVFIASKIRAGVTSRTCCASTAGVSTWPVAA